MSLSKTKGAIRKWRIVQSECSDYYIIPADKVQEWKDKWTFEEPPEWANYVKSLNSFTFENPRDD